MELPPDYMPVYPTPVSPGGAEYFSQVHGGAQVQPQQQHMYASMYGQPLYVQQLPQSSPVSAAPDMTHSMPVQQVYMTPGGNNQYASVAPRVAGTAYVLPPSTEPQMQQVAQHQVLYASLPPPQQYASQQQQLIQPQAFVQQHASSKVDPNLIFLGTNGYVAGLTMGPKGTTRTWTTNLKGTGYNLVTLYFHKPLNTLFVATIGYLYALWPHDGSIKWKISIPHARNAAHYHVTLMPCRNLLLCGTSGYVSAIDCESSNCVWSLNLEGTGFHSVQLCLSPDQETLYAGSQGEVHCCSTRTGKLLWKNTMKGYGYSVITLALHDRYLYCGTRGYIVKLNVTEGGRIEKEINLEGTGYKPVSLVPYGDFLFVGTNGQARAYDLRTDQMLWKNDLKGCGYPACVSLMPMGMQIFIGVTEHLLCLDITDGKIVYRTTVGAKGMMTMIPFTEELLLCANYGRLYALSKRDGRPLFSDNLPGLGYNHIMMATPLVAMQDPAAQPVVQVNSFLSGV